MSDSCISDEMCGRISFFLTREEIAFWLMADPGAIFENRYNLAPTQWVHVIRRGAHNGTRELFPLKWGLVPAWSNDMSIGAKMNNARAETVYEKNSFRNAIRRRRCIVPVSGFYEWRRAGKSKQAYHIHRKDNKLLALAGIWEENGAVPEGPIQTFSILTTTANATMSPIHDRMPVFIEHQDVDHWLDAKVEDVKEMLIPSPSELIVADPVSDFVNKAGNEGPQCVAPVVPEEKPEPDPKPAKAKKSKEASGQGMLFGD
jgi:putative SOS response-associated peptidase YedK